ncbi:MFS transporter [Streptomyces sp. NPDC049906]|uniref:MFS transporter n=1 Tax=Streptomyces sp. NPDC049906 TaxID=3155656 RepID=UPI0034495052
MTEHTPPPDDIGVEGKPAAPGSSTFRAHPRFLRIWLGQAGGAIGDQLLPVALSLYILREGGGAADVGLVLAGRAIALVSCLLIGGIIADRIRRTRILIGADYFRAVVLLGTALLLTRLPLGLLPVVTALIGAGEALSRPAYRSLIPTLLPDNLLERGNALVSAVHRGSAVLGAMAGAAAVTLIGVRPALLITSAVFALGALAVLRVPDAARKTGARAGVVGEAVEGLRAIRRRPWVMVVMGAVCLHLFAGSATALTLLPVIAREEFGGEIAYGYVLAALGLGALPAIVVAGRWRPKARGTVSMIALTCYALLPFSLAGPLPFPLVVLSFAIGGFVVELYFVYWLSALQRAFPDDQLGKVFAMDQLSAYALLPVGYLLVGPLVGLFGAPATLVGGGVVVFVSSLLCLLVPGVAQFANVPESEEKTTSRTVAEPR